MSVPSGKRAAAWSAVLAGFACLAAAPSAGAIGFTNLSSAPEDVTAGAHSDFTQHIELTNAADDIKNLIVHLPPGMVGDPTATPKCTVAQLNADNCPSNTQVGVTTTSALLLDIVPLTITGEVFNIDAQPGEPARFGIVLTPPAGAKVILQASASLRQDDFGLDTTINGIPNTADGLPITITALDLTLFGFANEGTAEEHSFMRNPTSCGEAATGFEATSYSGSTTVTPATGSASFTPTNCAALDFSPELEATLSGPTDQGEHPTLTTVITQSEGEAGLERAEVILPEDFDPNSAALNTPCTPAQFDSGTCPEESLLGTAEAQSPLLSSPLTGTVVQLLEDSTLKLGLALSGELSFKLRGDFVFSPIDGRPGNAFDNLPDIPISRFELTLDGGDGDMFIANRDLCDGPPPVLRTSYDGHNGESTTGNPSATVEGCEPPVPPTATLRLRDKTAEHPRLRFRGEAGSDPLRSARVKLPRGLHFAAGDDLTTGVTVKDDSGVLDDDAFEATRRKLTLTTPAAGGSDVLKLRAGGRSLVRTAKLGDPEFPLRLIDVDGLVTDLTG